jgi:predicted Zn-dependent protease with MMP-like domain
VRFPEGGNRQGSAGKAENPVACRHGFASNAGMTDAHHGEAANDADARLADLLSTMWEAYRNDDAAAGIVAGRQAVAAFPSQGEAWFWLACCLERAKDYRAADHAYLRAAKAGNEAQMLPFRVSWRHFQHAVESAGDSLPEPLRGALEEVTLVLADYAEPALLEGYDEPELLGLFAGSERSAVDAASDVTAPSISPCIYLFRRAHEHQCATRREFDLEVKQTLFHELGHYLGYDEDQLGELGRG